MLDSGLGRKLTTALPGELEEIRQWSERHGLVQIFSLLVDTTLLLERPLAVGSVLQVLSTDLANNVLRDWARDNFTAESLLRVSDALCGDPEFVERYEAITRAKPAITLVRGQSEQLYLLALLVARLPVIAPEEQEWFELLRLWLLVQAVDRASHGVILDENLQQVCTKLRLAHDATSEWLGFFQRVRIGQRSFTGLSLGLSYMAGNALAGRSRGGVEFSGSQRQVLRALISIAKPEDHPINQPFSMPARLTDIGLATGTARRLVEPFGRFDETEVDEIVYKTSEIAGEEAADSIRCVEVDPEASITRQGLSARTVLLTTAEENQFLPWAWGQPTRAELAQLDAWLAGALNAPSLADRLAAAIVWLAIATGRNLERVIEIQITDELQPEWALTKDLSCLRRTPPRPRAGWQPDSSSLEWIQPFADHQAIHLPKVMQETLLGISEAMPDMTSLGELLSRSLKEDPISLGRLRLTSVVPRLTPLMLSRVMPMRVFGVTNDGLFARALSSHPQSGLPGASAYASWTIGTVSRLLEPNQSASHDPGLNGLGSLLQVDEDRMVASIRAAASQVNKAREASDVLAFHNCYVAYHVVALLAATGARPIQDPFERHSHFDLKHEFAYVSDKASAPARDGRLIPIPPDLSVWLKEVYPRHLAMLSEVLQPVAPELAEAITQLTDPTIPPSLPLFFLLEQSEKGEIVWRSVSELAISRLGLFGWPLPLNFFRHRLSSRLRAAGLDGEIVDSLLGHAEAWAATHGDYSWRIWSADMEKARPHLLDLFAQTGFVPLTTWNQPPSLPPVLNTASTFGTRSFGIEMRGVERRKRQREAWREARMIIAETVGSRSLADLDGDELGKLALRLVTTSKGLPHAYAGLRYECLVRKARRIWQTTGRRVRFKRAYTISTQEPGLFTADAPGALVLYDDIRQALVPILAEVRASRPGHSASAYLAAVLLILENRITDRNLIEAVMVGKACRLVAMGEEVYLEYSPDHLDKGGDSNFAKSTDPSVPIRRFKVLHTVAWLWNRGQTGQRKQPTPLKTLPNLLAPVCGVLVEAGRLQAPDPGALIAVLASMVEQVNGMTLPGVLAGYLAGRVESYSLGWRDWLSLRWDERRDFLGGTEDELDIDEAAIHVTLPAPESGDSLQQQRNAQLLLRMVRAVLDGRRVELPGLMLEGVTNRRDQQVSIKRVLEQYGANVSSSIRALATWALHMLAERRGKLRIISIKRYLSALSPAFEAVAYDVDLLSSDEEEMTDFYEAVLNASPVKHLDYVARRLVNFHRWARGHYGLEDPDWSDLPMGSAQVSVDAGVLRERDYQAALGTLLSMDPAQQPVARDAAFMLLIAYRFGLRGGEALGLARSDWVAQGGQQIVLVRGNRHRRLKTAGSRRIVPLVFDLDVKEQALIEERLLRAESIHGDAQHARLFSTDDGQPANRRAVKELAIQVIKKLSGNPEANLHRARHAAANRVMLSLLRQLLPGWQWLGDAREMPDIGNVLLGGTGDTRRLAWALARYMGHSNPKTALASYLHFLGEMAEEVCRPIEAGAEGKRLTYDKAIDLAAFPCLQAETVEMHTGGSQPRPIRPGDALMYLRLRARGRPVEQIVATQQVDAEWTRRVEAVLSEVGATLRLGATKHRDRSQRDALEFLRRVNEKAWQRLLAVTAKKDITTSSIPGAGWESLAWMVGSTGQIMLVREPQFRLLRAALDYWGVGAEKYDILVTHEAGRIYRRVLNQKFTPLAKVDRHGKRARIDTATTDVDGSRATERCACVFQENDHFVIRNRIEFVVALLGYAFSTMTLENQNRLEPARNQPVP